VDVLSYTKQLELKPSAIAVGKFDGIHLGHQAVLKEVIKQKKLGLQAVVVTFVHSPKTVTEHAPKNCLITKQERNLLLEQMGIDVVVELPVTEDVLNLQATEFLEDILCTQFHMGFIAAGADFCFGKNRQGNVELLMEQADSMGYQAVILEKEKMDAVTISSSYIKALLVEGKMEQITRLLGHPYCVIGKVVHGNQLGRTVGMPTINLLPEADKLLPPNGVYASQVTIQGQVYTGITNVGYKPTVAQKKQMGVEMHIFDFNEDVYGETVCVTLLSFVRPERKFDNLEQVKKQVDLDIASIKKTVM
jgi:riboflavin kinase/FMN adenylyltransferase